MDYDTYVPRERVRAAQVLKPTQGVLTTGPVLVERYGYVVERTVTDEFGEAHTETQVMSKDLFNDTYKRLDWKESERQDAYNSGYEEGWKQCETAHDYAETVVGSDHADSDEAPDHTQSDRPSTGTETGGHPDSGTDGSNINVGEPTGMSR